MKKHIDTELIKASEITNIPKEELLRLISKDFTKGELPRFMKIANIPFAKALIEEITHESKEVFAKLNSQLIDRAKDTFRIIIYNLVVSTFTRSRLSLPGSKDAYKKGSYYSKLFFTRNSVKAALKALDNYLICKPGNKYKHEVDSYEPNRLFQIKLLPLLYCVYIEYNEDTEIIVIQDKDQKSFNKIVYSASKPSGNQGRHIMRVNPTVDIERTYVEDFAQLQKINNALKDATYPLKAPIQRIYSRGQVMMGGRIYTRLANLPDKKARIRINTLFNGNEVAEVDLKANHPSMLYAINGKQLPSDFYDIVASESGQARNKVKWLVMKLIGAPNKAISLAANINDEDYFKSKFVMTKNQQELIESAIKLSFPDLYESFYKDMGVVLQGLEGDIMLDAMCELIDRKVLSLPIHDALYVEKKNIDLAERALKKSWKKNLNVDFEPFVEIDS